MDGFSFAGTHSGTLGCHYHPDAKARGDGMADYEVSDLAPDERDGGYYIGARIKPRVFELDCYFEEISGAMLEGIYRWLDRRNSGT